MIAPPGAIVPAAQSGQHPVIAYLSRLAPSSRRTMRTALNTIAQLFDPRYTWETFAWHELRYPHVQMIRAKLAAEYAPKTANRHLSALRGVITECWRLGYITVEERERANDVEGVRGQREPAGRYVTAQELRAILLNCLDGSPIGTRDAAILGVLYTCGLRRAELGGDDLNPDDPGVLYPDDYNRETGEMLVHGKGNKDRSVDVVNQAFHLVEAWLKLRGDWGGALFTSMRKGGYVTHRRIGAQGIYDMIIRRGKAAGVKFSPHDLRRSLISDLFDAGVDGVIISRIVGHANLETTGRYDRRPRRARRLAAEKIDLPI